MRLLSLTAGSIVLIGGLYVAVGERMAGTSADATVNARIMTLRAPIEGTVSLFVRDVGARVEAHQMVAEIFDSRYDTVRLLELERSQSALKTDLERTKAQLQALNSAREQLQAQSTHYQTGRVRQIEARLGEAQASLDASQARLREADSALKRTTDLSSRGLQTAITLDKAKSGYDVALQEIESVRQRIAYLNTELAAARNGVFLGDSYNDTPFSSQRIRELDLRLAELKAEQEQIQHRLTLSDQHIAAERVRLNKLTSAALSSQSTGRVWDVLADNGEYVRRGQDVMRLVDCSSVLITASVSEGIFNSLKPGGQAQLRLFGDDRVFDATIMRLGGAAANSLYSNLAVGPSAEHLKRFDVTLSAPDLAKHPDLECAVGRTGRLIFTSGPVAALKQVATRFGL
jgi:multidrug resistance efflux pump